MPKTKSKGDDWGLDAGLRESPRERGRTTGREWYTPPEIARELGIDPEKVLVWIRSGELSAVNIAQSATGRPRYRIAPKDFEAFLDRRRSRPPAPRIKRRRQSANVTEFY